MSSTLDQMAIVASQIKEATKHGENTALRVGGLLVDLVDYLDTLHIDEVTLGPLLTALNNAQLTDPADGQTLVFNVISGQPGDWTFSSALTQLKIKIGKIETTVASNYQVFLDAQTQIQAELDDVDRRIRENYAEYSTWRVQTDTYIAEYATAYDEEGNLISMSQIVQTADEIDQKVTEMKFSSTNLADPDMWEQGTTHGEETGDIYDDHKIDSTTRIRTVALIPISYDSYITFDPEDNDYAISILYFKGETVEVEGEEPKKIKVFSNPTQWAAGWCKLSEQESGRVKLIDANADVQYIAIRIKNAADTTETPINITVEDDLKKVGITLFNSDVATYSEIKQTARAIEQAVSDSEEYTDQLKAMINTDVLKDDQGNYAYATFKQQTNDLFIQIAGKFDPDTGELIGYSSISQTADEILEVVSDNKDAADAAFKNINEVVIPGLEDDIEDVDDKATNSATWITNNKDRIALISAQFDDDGNLTNTSGLVTTAGFSTLFATEVTEQGIAKTADLSVYVQHDENNNIVTGIKMKADQITMDADTFAAWVSTYKVSADDVDFTANNFNISADHITLTGNSAIENSIATKVDINDIENYIELSVGKVGINISEEQITLKGNTTVDGILTVTGDVNGFVLSGDNGQSYITGESIGSYNQFIQKATPTIYKSLGISISSVSGYQVQGTGTFYALGNVEADKSYTFAHSSASIRKPNSGQIINLSNVSVSTVIKKPTGEPLATGGSSVTFTPSSYSGEIWATVTVSGTASSTVDTSQGYYINETCIYTTPANSFMLIGQDGWGANFGDYKIVYFGGNDGSYMRYGSYGFAVTTSGLKKWNGSSWVAASV